MSPEDHAESASPTRRNARTPRDKTGEGFLKAAILVPILLTGLVGVVPPDRLVKIDPWTLKWWVVRTSFLVQLAVFLAPLIALCTAKYAGRGAVIAATILGLLGLGGCGLVQVILTGPGLFPFLGKK